jgi:hypothetical protein
MRIPGWVWDMLHGAVWGFAVAAAASAFVLAQGCHRSWGASGQAVEEGGGFGTRGPGGRQGDGGGVVEPARIKCAAKGLKLGEFVSGPLSPEAEVSATHASAQGLQFAAGDSAKQLDPGPPANEILRLLRLQREPHEMRDDYPQQIHPGRHHEGHLLPMSGGSGAFRDQVPATQKRADLHQDGGVIGPETNHEPALGRSSAFLVPKGEYKTPLPVRESREPRPEMFAAGGGRKGQDGARMFGSHDVFLARQGPLWSGPAAGSRPAAGLLLL